MTSRSGDVAGRPSSPPTAPPRESTPLPASFSLSADPATVAFDDGAVVMGGSPLRLWRLSPRAQRLVERWTSGARIGEHRTGQLLARRFVSSGAFVPQPSAASWSSADVTVVIPVRNRPDQLARVLEALAGLRCVVVDDASHDSSLTKDIAERFGVAYLGLGHNVGPGAARNAALALITSRLVAFVDSDCLPPPGWLDALLGYFDDPLVGAVAPRIVPLAPATPTRISRYEQVRSSLDRGHAGGLVRPKSRIPYVPSAALVVRRAVAGEHLFDPRLRTGEDVDLVWRLAASGWDVRYEPASTVEHEGPGTLGTLLARRFTYGTSAAPLAHRHGKDMAPLSASVWSLGVWVLAALRRPVAASAVLTTSVLVLTSRLRRLVKDPVSVAAQVAGGGTARSALPALSGLTRAWSPALCLGLLWRRTRGRSALALLLPALHDWLSDSGGLDAATYVGLHVADDLSYGAGVWWGCARERTVGPLMPDVVLRSSVWSSGSLQRHLGPAGPPEEQTPEGA